jgi:hypothetical protein
MTRVIKPRLPHRRQTRKNNKAKFLIIQKLKNKTNSNKKNEDQIG